MMRGLYTAASGLVADMRRIEAVTNNITNAQTPGFKQERTSAATFGETLLARVAGQRGGAGVGPLVLSAAAQAPALDLDQGPIQPTGRALDVALEGPGFLAVQTAGGLRYTRDGSFTRDAQGFLITATGATVLGEDGPIQVVDGPIRIETDGTVRSDDTVVGRLAVVEFEPDTILERVGNNELVPTGGAEPAPAAGTAVRQGAIEASNVDLTSALTSALSLQRAYEANQRMIQSTDEMMGKAANEIARPTS